MDTAFGNIGNTHCIQSSKTKNENTTFVLWIDDLDSDDGYLNNPDLFGVSHGHCPWGADDISFPVNFSENDLYQGFNFYPFVAEYSIDGDGYYEIIAPVTESVNPSEWASDDSETSITHNYVSGVFMPPTCVNEVEENNFDEQIFEVAQNVPNPVKDFTEIEVVYYKIAPVNIEVCNLLGQIIITQDMGLIYNEMSINLDLTDEDSGVYFYTIKIGDEKITKKMVLE